MMDKQLFDKFVFPESGECIEVRALDAYGNSSAWEGYARGTVVGYYDAYDPFRLDVSKLQKVDKTVRNLKIYMSAQVIDPSLLGRACNELIPSQISAKDKDVINYRWF